MQGLYRWDMETFRAVNLGPRSPALDVLFLILSVTGLGGIEALFALCFYPWPRLRRFIVPLVVSIAFTGLLLADGIKALVRRDRPSYLVDAIVQEDAHTRSFISGHTTTAFAFATMLTLLLLGSKRWWIGPLTFIWAIGVAYSRVYRGVHWPTDVLAGASAGTAGSALVYLIFARKGWLNLSLRRPSTEKPAPAPP